MASANIPFATIAEEHGYRMNCDLVTGSWVFGHPTNPSKILSHYQIFKMDDTAMLIEFLTGDFDKIMSEKEFNSLPEEDKTYETLRGKLLVTPVKNIPEKVPLFQRFRKFLKGE